MRILPIGLLAAAVVVAGCDDGFGPGDWDDTPIEVELFSLDRPENLRLPAAYDAVRVQRVVVENPGSTGNWDFAVTESGGEFRFTPAGVFPAITSRAAVGVITGETMATLTRAPADTSVYRSEESVPVEIGRLYVFRSRQYSDAFRGSCVRYGKMEPDSINVAEGSVRFKIVINPNCNDRSLVPPE